MLPGGEGLLGGALINTEGFEANKPVRQRTKVLLLLCAAGARHN